MAFERYAYLFLCANFYGIVSLNKGEKERNLT